MKKKFEIAETAHSGLNPKSLSLKPS